MCQRGANRILLHSSHLRLVYARGLAGVPSLGAKGALDAPPEETAASEDAIQIGLKLWVNPLTEAVQQRVGRGWKPMG